jgi:predicted amidohydrolase
MLVAAVQTEPVFGAVARNRERAAALVRETAAKLYVLPELFATGYFFGDRAEVEACAEEFPTGETCRFLASLSREREAVIAGGFPEKARDGKVYNAAALFDRGRAVGVYRKIHLFDREGGWFDAGTRPPRALDTSVGRLGLMICFDWIFPETARCLALDGAHILLHPSNLVMPYAQDAMVTRCLENRVAAVTANRVGRDARAEEALQFTGRSQITGVSGRRLAQATADREEVIVSDLDPLDAEEKRINPANHLFRDRRPGLYKALVA